MQHIAATRGISGIGDYGILPEAELLPDGAQIKNFAQNSGKMLREQIGIISTLLSAEIIENILIIGGRFFDCHKDAYSNFTSIRWKRRCAGSSPAGR